MKFLHLICILLTIFLFASCKCSNDRRAGEFEVPDSIANLGVLEISEQAMENVTQNISSHIETAALIKNLNVPFSKEHLASTSVVDNFTKHFDQALLLGIYGADLGYLNMYNKTTVALDYLTSIRKLANNLNVGQFFDFNTLQRLAKNNENLDSLMYISQRNFNQMDQYLRENQRSNLSTLMVTGGWIEGLYLSGKVFQDKPDHDLRVAIGEQKIIMADLMILLKNFEKDPEFARLIKSLDQLHSQFRKVRITIEKGEPESQVVDGRLVIIQNEKSIVTLSDELLGEIINESIKLRNQLLNL